ncbi:MAG: 3-keto-5-aminohexanoate cleavage protein [Tistlia sp.]
MAPEKQQASKQESQPAKAARKVIITCAVTGSIHTPSMTPYLPITPGEIAEASVGAAAAAASIIHLHARDPETGKPTPDPKVFMEFLPRIKQACDAVVNITTGGGHGMSLDDRLAAPLMASPEMTSLNMGSMNFGLFPILDKMKDFQHDWEPAYLEASRDFIFRNTFKDIESILKRLGQDHGTRFEFECYDVGHLYNLAHFLDRGLVEPPLFVQTIFGILGGIGADPENLMHMRRIADKLFGSDYQWSILAAGRHQMPFCSMGATMGANVRVGLEDSIYLAKGKLAETNAAQVRKIRGILEELSLEIATPAEARAMLQLKGGDRVAF